MPQIKRLLIIMGVLIGLLTFLTILQQARCKEAEPKVEPVTLKVAPSPEDDRPRPNKWWEAQRRIETSIADLQAYLKESPSSEYAQAASRQLEVLRGLTVTNMPQNWVTLSGDVVWRIASVDQQADKSRLTIQIKNTRNQEESAFDAFDTAPLILIDSNGEYYRMLYNSPLPQG